MIPLFNDCGYLPAGIHVATLEEISLRFGQQSELCTVQFESVTWLIELAGRAGVRRLILNGSFVTDVLEPNDVDCVLSIGPGFPLDQAAEAELLEGLPFLEIELVDENTFDDMVHRFFATDRLAVPKGMIEVLL